MIFRLILEIAGWDISHIQMNSAGRHWMGHRQHPNLRMDMLTDYKSTLVQVMAWCRQAASHYLSQCWPSSMLPHGIARPQWVNWIDFPCCFANVNDINPCIFQGNKTYRYLPFLISDSKSNVAGSETQATPAPVDPSASVPPGEDGETLPPEADTNPTVEIDLAPMKNEEIWMDFEDFCKCFK